MGNNNVHARSRSRFGLPVLVACTAVVLATGLSARCVADDAPGDHPGATSRAGDSSRADQIPRAGDTAGPTFKNTPQTRAAEKLKHHEPDFTAKKRMGKASFYAKRFAGKTMADGAPMDPAGDNAASKTLPLGTTAKVTNLETGKSAVVTIQDRGPYVPGRIVDLSPATAREIGISQRKGVALVVVAPIAVPQADGKIKLGAAAHEPLPAPGVEPGSEPIREAAADTRTVRR
jgi:rare lipoprotein A